MSSVGSCRTFPGQPSHKTASWRENEPTYFDTLVDDQCDAIGTLRMKLIEPPILMLPKRHGRMNLDTDACKDQVGCALLQEQPEGALQP